MATTSPDNLWTPDSGDGYALTQDLAAFADTIQDALEVRANYYTGNNSQMANQESKATEGSMFFNTDDDKEYRLVSGAWVEAEASGGAYNYVWADATARNAQTGMVAGDRGYQEDNKVVYLYSGSGWVAWESWWITYTPSLTNISVGTGGSAVSSAVYRFEQGRVRVKFRFVLGSSGSSMGTTPKMTLPFEVGALNHSYNVFPSDGTMFDFSINSARLLKVVADASSTTVVRFAYIQDGSGGGGLFDYPNATTPWTWASGDAISGELVYDPA